MYPADWHTLFGDMTGKSAVAILPELVQAFETKSLVEIGCGNAHWTRAGLEAGVTDYLVVDGPWNKREDLLVDKSHFLEADLAVPLKLDRRYDMAVCLEVAEHVRGASAEILVKSLTDASDVVAFGAAIPLQGGWGHINEQWPSWWRDRFVALGYEPFDLVRPRHWNNRELHYWYRQNMFVYVNKGNAAAIEHARAAEARIKDPKFLFDAVHPEKFEEMASYETIALKRLARQFPRWVGRRLRARIAG